MIVYLDTSAVVPILIAEPSTETCRRIWTDTDRLVSSRLTYVEVAAALAMAERRERVSTAEHDQAWANFADIWPDVDVVELGPELAARAAVLARSTALRGYDSVQCASAVAVEDDELVAAAGDVRLLDAWRELGLTVLDVNRSR